MKKRILLLALSLTLFTFACPVVSEAAWWNPVDWINYFTHKPTTNQLPPAVTVSSSSTGIVSSMISTTTPTKNNALINKGPNTSVPAKPTKFYSTAGKFSVDFPGLPTLSTTTLYLAASPTTSYLYYYLKQIDNELSSVFAIMYFELPNYLTFNDSSTGTVAGSLSDIMSTLLVSQETSNSAKLVSSKMGSYQGYPSDDYLLYQTAKGLYMRGRIVLGTSKAYTLFVEYKDDKNSAQNSKLAQEFLDSLIIAP